SSRQTPFIRFEQNKKLHRLALEVTGLSKSYDNELYRDLNLMVEVGERVAIIGQNGVGKTTLLKCLVGDTELTSGEVKWSENAQLGYYAQDHSKDFEQDMTLVDWMYQWAQEGDDEQIMRGTLGRLLFSQNEITKAVNVISGGEQGRMMFGKLMLERPNILLMDEPTNHMDMESIEALNLALENYAGTLLFVSHDREFVSTIATRIIDITADGIVDFKGNYDSYLASQAGV
ncbi:MAG: ATPase subunit of ABC transporter with duplicated ATPase domains, partial [Oleiphilaceae bacterium]